MASTGEVRARADVLQVGVASLGLAIALLIALAAIPVAQEAMSPAEPATRAGPPEILRGSVAPPLPAIEPAAGPDQPQMTAGDRIWFIDRDSRRLTGCRLIDTIRVDTQAIRCTERRLPRGAVVRD